MRPLLAIAPLALLLAAFGPKPDATGLSERTEQAALPALSASTASQAAPAPTTHAMARESLERHPGVGWLQARAPALMRP
jgi:hypothetical protein